MYLCHVNFIPVNGSRLLDTARREAGCYKVHDNGGGEKITAWINTLREDLTAQYTNAGFARNPKNTQEAPALVKSMRLNAKERAFSAVT